VRPQVEKFLLDTAPWFKELNLVLTAGDVSLWEQMKTRVTEFFGSDKKPEISPAVFADAAEAKGLSVFHQAEDGTFSMDGNPINIEELDAIHQLRVKLSCPETTPLSRMLMEAKLKMLAAQAVVQTAVGDAVTDAYIVLEGYETVWENIKDLCSTYGWQCFSIVLGIGVASAATALGTYLVIKKWKKKAQLKEYDASPLSLIKPFLSVLAGVSSIVVGATMVGNLVDFKVLGWLHQIRSLVQLISGKKKVVGGLKDACKARIKELSTDLAKAESSMKFDRAAALHSDISAVTSDLAILETDDPTSSFELIGLWWKYLFTKKDMISLGASVFGIVATGLTFFFVGKYVGGKKFEAAFDNLLDIGSDASSIETEIPETSDVKEVAKVAKEARERMHPADRDAMLYEMSR
jgi:hypothetical protein